MSWEGVGAKPTMALRRGLQDRRAPHLLLDSVTEVLLDELPAGGRLQLQVTLQTLEWRNFMPTHAHVAAKHSDSIRCGFAKRSAGAMDPQRVLGAPEDP